MNATVVVKSLEEKHGTSKTGKAYVQHKLVDANGEIYSCFDGSIVDPIRNSTGEKVDIQYEEQGRFKNLISAKPHETAGALSGAYTHQKPDGDADWDLIGLRKTRCALWVGILEGISTSLYAAHKGNTGRFLEHAVLLVGAAEKDIFERAPGDDGIPFSPEEDIEI